MGGSSAHGRSRGAVGAAGFAMSGRSLTLVAVVASACTAVLLAVGPAVAHPLGNFTANSSTLLVVGADATRLDYVLDLAEIPALQERQRIDADGDGEVDGSEAERYRDAACTEVGTDQVLTVDGKAVEIRPGGSSLSFPPGQAGLFTLRLECALTADTGPLGPAAQVAYVDSRDLDRVGWREVVAVGDGTRLIASDVPQESPSARLTRYPEDQLASPLDVRSATLTVDPSSATTEMSADAGDRAAPGNSPSGAAGWIERSTTAFTDLVARQDLTVAFGLLAFALSIGLGTLHALAPGHGKTVMAAYLVGRHGTATQALTLGATVAATHTLGVLLLGLALTLTQTLAPERLYPYLGAISGAVFAAVGVGLLRGALAHRGHVPHGHGPSHDHPHAAGHDDVATGPRWQTLIAPGLAGGMVPSPSALVVLLGGIAVGRMWFGIVLVIGYGIGMAATLIGAGYLLLLTGALPVLTSALITVGGFAIAVRSIFAI